jgi:hypothetical protein
MFTTTGSERSVMSLRDNRRKPLKSGGPTGEDLRRQLHQRRQASAVHIRKQRKEDFLRRKRHMPTSATAVSSNAPLAATVSDVGGMESDNDNGALLLSLDAAIQEKNMVQLQALLVSRDNAKNSTESSTGVSSLPLLILQDPERLQALLQVVLQMLQAPESDSTIPLVLDILWHIVSIPSPPMAADDYYGTPPPRWCNKLVELEDLMRTLVSLSSKELTVQILGTLVLDAPRAVHALLPYWQPLVEQLPVTSYVCAALLRQDASTLGMHFITSLTPSKLTALLNNEASAVEAAWMLESLTRREDAVVETLCQDAHLLPTLCERLLQATHHAWREFLVPALQSLENIAVACNGHYIRQILLTPSVLQACSTILDQGLVMDVLPLVTALVCDAGLPDHPSTTIAVPALLPRVLHVVAHPASTLAWRREAVSAVCAALREPPDCDPSLFSHIQATLDSFLVTYLWNTPTREAILEGLLDLLQRPDTQAVLASLEVLDRWLRHIPASRVLLEELSGVDRLDLVCSRAVGVYSAELEEASTIAAALLDDFFEDDDDLHHPSSPFDDDDDDDEDAVYSGYNKTSPVHNQCVFRAPATGIFDFSTPATASGGRGRGRTVPAWMQSR